MQNIFCTAKVNGARRGRKTTAVDLRRAGKFPEKTFSTGRGWRGGVLQGFLSSRKSDETPGGFTHLWPEIRRKINAPPGRAYTIQYIYNIYIFNRRVDHEPAPRSTLCGLILQFLTTFDCNHPDKTLSFFSLRIVRTYIILLYRWQQHGHRDTSHRMTIQLNCYYYY